MNTTSMSAAGLHARCTGVALDSRRRTACEMHWGLSTRPWFVHRQGVMLTEITPVLKPDIACHLPHNTVGSFGGDEADFALQKERALFSDEF